MITDSEIRGWFTGRVPADLYDEILDTTVDREEIIVVGELPALTEEYADEAARAAAEEGRINPVRGIGRRMVVGVILDSEVDERYSCLMEHSVVRLQRPVIRAALKRRWTIVPELNLDLRT